LCLGGADQDRKLWPEPRRSIEPIWYAEKKDDLEARLCQMVCAGEIDAAAAQAEIRDDWTESYRNRFRQGGEVNRASEGTANAMAKYRSFVSGLANVLDTPVIVDRHLNYVIFCSD
jgi:hypothetical protein